MTILIFIRTTALTVGAAAAGVGCYASYEAAAQANGGYLMLAAPIVALAAALIPCYAERAWHDRQYVRALAMALVWILCVATVLLTAVERNHLAKAGGEAERAALRTTADRAKAELTEAKAAAAAATLAANKVRGIDAAKCKASCQSIRATETAALARVQTASAAITAAEGKAVTESTLKQPDWLLALALELAGMFLIACGFGLGRAPVQVAPVVTAPVVVAAPQRAKDPKRVAAGVKAAATRRRREAARKLKMAA